MWPMQSARTFPSRLNSISSAHSDWDRWSRYSEVDSTFEYAYDDTPRSPTQDLGDLVRDSQLALNVLRNADDDESCFNFGDGSEWGDYDDWQSHVSPMTRRPTRKYGSIASRYTAHSGYGRRHPSREESRRYPPQTQTKGGMLAPGGNDLGRMPSVRQGRINSAASRRGSRLDRHASLLRRVTTKRRGPKPLPPTKEDSEDADSFEASIARLSASSLLDLNAPSLLGSTKATPPVPSNPFGPAAARQPGHQSDASALSSSAASSATLQDAVVQEYKPYRPPGQQSPPRKPEAAWVPPAPAAAPFPEWQESNVERSVTVRNVRLGAESSVASLVSTSEKPMLPYSPPGSPPPAGEPTGPDESAAAKGLRLAAITLALASAVFVVGMDVNIISTAIPHITTDFNSLDDIGWYGSSFLMTTCAFQVLFGRIYTLFSAKWVFVSALAIFEAGSLLCALAPNSILFILGRAIQGIGTSGILSGALIIGALIVPLSKRALLGGIIGAMEGVAMISAPLIGGFFTDRLTW
jgi:hypothetical protein